ncbi:MAG: sulfatase [Chloroflexi bacterium]|nr:sulfatase [Chloroflexota bacterium]
MNHGLSRRDFLKLAGLASLGMVVPPSVQHLGGGLQGDKKNVLIIVFDALAAYNVSLYGYGRATTPNLTRLANRATVFHNHFAGGNFTTPGTASLLTGTLPWTHRALGFNDPAIASFSDKSIFHAFDDYHRVAYSHNTLVNTLFRQFLGGITEYVPQDELFLFNDGFIRKLFPNDEDTATVGWARAVKRTGGYSYSLFLSQLYEKYRDSKVADAARQYPLGLPSINNDNYFTLEQGVDWLAEKLNELPRPFMGYFHFLPPHFPYKPHRDFVGAFSNDSFQPPSKPEDLFTEGRSNDFLQKWRNVYDEFILHVDSEFARLFDALERSGVLDNTWLVFTSDHGELFERGIWAHSTPTFYQPIVRVPLMIFEPGSQEGREVYEATSAIDLMPTLLHLTGHSIPACVEGRILPPYAAGAARPGQPIYAGPRETQQAYSAADGSHCHARQRQLQIDLFPRLQRIRRGRRACPVVRHSGRLRGT